jgi:hypothetical protein
MKAPHNQDLPLMLASKSPVNRQHFVVLGGYFSSTLGDVHVRLLHGGDVFLALWFFTNKIFVAGFLVSWTPPASCESRSRLELRFFRFGHVKAKALSRFCFSVQFDFVVLAPTHRNFKSGNAFEIFCRASSTSSALLPSSTRFVAAFASAAVTAASTRWSFFMQAGSV